MTDTGLSLGPGHSDLRHQFEAIVGNSAKAPQIAEDLFTVATVLHSQPSLCRALTDAGRPVTDREALLRRLVAERIDDTAVDVLVACVGDRWDRPAQLAAAVDECGVLSYLVAARSHSRLDRVGTEVFGFAQIVQDDRSLRAALLDRSAPVESRRQLIDTLLAGKVSPETIKLIEHAVLDGTERSLEADLERVIEFVARLRERRVAVIRVAAALTATHRDRLERALVTRVGGPVLMNVVVEPEIVGGVKIEVGDEVVDGTVTSRLATVRRQLAASR
jgi:F-type H+-transporting ATPase subunit delta